MRKHNERNLGKVGPLDYEPLSRRQAMTALGEVVYAARFPSTGIIKFGWTKDLDHRFDCLASAEGERPALVGFRRGNYDDEWVIHDRLRAYRVGTRREFYHPTEQVLAEVAAMRDELGLPPLP